MEKASCISKEAHLNLHIWKVAENRDISLPCVCLSRSPSLLSSSSDNPLVMDVWERTGGEQVQVVCVTPRLMENYPNSCDPLWKD